MGKDDLHKKRKKRRAAALGRRSSSREPYDRVLLVTEGSKTEPNYLRELVRAHGLSAVNIVVDSNSGSDPKSVFKYAQMLFEEAGSDGEPFDRVYCVFDKDGHKNYKSALDAIQRATPKNTFHAINSVPCFEYWVLLHFRATTRPYAAPEGQSSCELLMKDLRKEFPEYKKSETDLYRKLKNKTDTAIENARKSLAAAKTAGTDNPTTRVHLLVEDLYSLKN